MNGKQEPTHSASVLNMVPIVTNLSNILVAVGKNWNELTLWDGNHRALAYYGAVRNGFTFLNSHGDVVASKIPGCQYVLKELMNYTLFVGISDSIEHKPDSFLCG